VNDVTRFFYGEMRKYPRAKHVLYYTCLSSLCFGSWSLVTYLPESLVSEAVDSCCDVQLLAVPSQEKELAKEMDGLSLAQGSSSASGGAAGATDGVKKYNKSSFFDEISCDVLDRAAGTLQSLTHAFVSLCLSRSPICVSRARFTGHARGRG